MKRGFIEAERSSSLALDLQKRFSVGKSIVVPEK